MEIKQSQLTNHGHSKESWFVKHPGRFKRDQYLIAQDFSTLTTFIENGKVYLKGEIPIFDFKAKNELTRYSVKIEFPDKYPKKTPIVYETGGKIIRTAEWHVNSNNGSLCIFLPEAVTFNFEKIHTIVDFLDALYGFLVLHYIKVYTGQYPKGAWGHGSEGLLEFYKKEIGVSDDKIIARLLYHLIAPKRGQISANDLCPCNKEKKFKKCHLITLTILEGKTTKLNIRSALSLLLDRIKKSSLTNKN